MVKWRRANTKQMKPAQNVHFSPRNSEVHPQILSTREKKKEKQNEKGRNIFWKENKKGK